MHSAILRGTGWTYRHMARPLIFRFDSEGAHEGLLSLGRRMGENPRFTRGLRALFGPADARLVTTVAGIPFPGPIGLAAGFDYRAELPNLLPGLGFGFGTVGTLTHEPYEGNPRPRLGRLVRSRSLLVNKGFKNEGVKTTLEKWKGKTFPVPVGVSLGRTNTPVHTTQAAAIDDILAAFGEAESSGVAFAYYELNISCPNLLSDIEFYTPERLGALLDAVLSLGITRPIFVKMPITLSDEDTLKLVDIILEKKMAGVIVGNLQKNRHDPALLPEEVARYAKGNFSGMACQSRSDELIAKIFTHTGGRLPIIGCGGVFSAEDAYRKIRLGASLVQLVTALIFEGPTVPAHITAGLAEKLERERYASLAQAVGAV